MFHATFFEKVEGIRIQKLIEATHYIQVYQMKIQNYCKTKAFN